MFNPKTFPRRLVRLRKAAGLRQIDLARSMKVHYVQVWRWEHGERVPQTMSLMKLAKSLSVSLDELVGR